jgi:hypothetical protein
MGLLIGGGTENRTPIFSLQDCSSPVELYPHGALTSFRAKFFCSSGRRVDHNHYQRELERIPGYGPGSVHWQCTALPLSYIRMVGNRRIGRRVPEGAGFTDPLIHQTWRFPYLVAQEGFEPSTFWL